MNIGYFVLKSSDLRYFLRFMGDLLRILSIDLEYFNILR